MINASDTSDLKDNLTLLNQDCHQPLFRWFLSRIDWKRILKEMK